MIKCVKFVSAFGDGGGGFVEDRGIDRESLPLRISDKMFYDSPVLSSELCSQPKTCPKVRHRSGMTNMIENPTKLQSTRGCQKTRSFEV